jgi:hypothetical protein
MLDFAVSRGTRLRRRRVAMRSGMALAAAVVAIALPLAAVNRDGSPSSNRVTVADTPDAQHGVAFDVQGGEGAGGAGGSGGDGAGTGSTPGADGASGAQPSSPAGPARASGVPAAGPGGAVGGPISESSPPQQAGACPAGQVELSVSTDKSAYLLTEDVQVTVRAVNRSGGPCLAPTSYTISFNHTTLGLAHRRNQPLRQPGSMWQPGEAIEHIFVWNQACAEAPCAGTSTAPRGDYSASVTWQGPAQYGPAAAAFRLN